jgi:hypothetical protein
MLLCLCCSNLRSTLAEVESDTRSSTSTKAVVVAMMSFEESGEKVRAEAPHEVSVSGRCSRSSDWRSRTRLGFKSPTEDFSGDEQHCDAMPSGKHVHLLVTRRALFRKHQRQLASIRRLILHWQQYSFAHAESSRAPFSSRGLPPTAPAAGLPRLKASQGDARLLGQYHRYSAPAARASLNAGRLSRAPQKNTRFFYGRHHRK